MYFALGEIQSPVNTKVLFLNSAFPDQDIFIFSRVSLLQVTGAKFTMTQNLKTYIDVFQGSE